jgi:hypothetical protein
VLSSLTNNVVTVCGVVLFVRVRVRVRVNPNPNPNRPAQPTTSSVGSLQERERPIQVGFWLETVLMYSTVRVV